MNIANTDGYLGCFGINRNIDPNMDAKSTNLFLGKKNKKHHVFF